MENACPTGTAVPEKAGRIVPSHFEDHITRYFFLIQDNKCSIGNYMAHLE